MKDTSYQVAGFGLTLSLPADCDPDAKMPNMVPFRCDAPSQPLITVTAGPDVDADYGCGAEIEGTEGDLGRVSLCHSATRPGWLVLKVDVGMPEPVVALCNPDFTSIVAKIDFTQRRAWFALNSIVRVSFAQAIIKHGAISMHASVVGYEGRAYMFFGPSGRGKSTHSRMWLEAIEGTELINDDNPIVRLVDGKLIVYGSPWSGKTPCYRAVQAPVALMASIERAEANSYEPLQGAEAFLAILPGCSSVHKTGTFFPDMTLVLSEMLGLTAVGNMHCLPNHDAALTLRASLGESRL